MKRKSKKKLLGDQSFFEPKSLQELAQRQGVGPVKDISVFAGVIRDDEDVDAMVEEIYRMREPVARRRQNRSVEGARRADNES